jgi:hypothetical protein
MRIWKSILALAATITFSTSGFAWDPQGHKLVGAIADQMLNANAKQQVAQILGFSLQIAAPWPDCVRSIVHKFDPQPKGSFDYLPSPFHPEYRVPCLLFEGTAEVDRMKDYVERNPANGAYHFADVPIQRDGYDRKYPGTSDHDVVSAINAAILVLQDQPAPPPFSIKDKKEALFLLAHFVGDIHQPLHVGAVYLDPANGQLVNPPDGTNPDPKTETQGGNVIRDGGNNLHAKWDEVSDAWGPPPGAAMLATARGIAATPDPISGWAASWASDTVKAAQIAFNGLTFLATAPGWTVIYADRRKYDQDMDMLKGVQLAKGGARLAQVLNKIWP